jgi:hypothetical protein
VVADPDDGELPPQPAAITVTATVATSATTRRPDGREKVGCVGVIVRVL